MENKYSTFVGIGRIEYFFYDKNVRELIYVFFNNSIQNKFVLKISNNKKLSNL